MKGSPVTDNVISFPGWGTGNPFGDLHRQPPELLRARPDRMAYVVRIDLDDVRPPIWRRLRLASDVSLAQLHAFIQVAMGWTDSHLHHFQMGPDTKNFRIAPFLTDFDMEDKSGTHERDVRLDQTLTEPGQRLFYEYDFGDSWEHTIELEGVEAWVEGDPEASCIAGCRACPPEDVGGIPGYETALAALKGEPGEDPAWTQQILEWLPPGYDPDAFDVHGVNQMLGREPLDLDLDLWHPALEELLGRAGGQFSPVAQLVREATAERVELTDDEMDAATHRYRHLIATVGDGLKLTQAGYLPPALVRQLFAELHLDEGWPVAPGREDQTGPVLSLRESAVGLGLLRKQHGKLLPTATARRLAGNPRALFTHVRERLPLGRRDCEKDAGLIILLIRAGGGDPGEQRGRGGEALESLGWQSNVPLATALWYESEPTRGALDHLTGVEPDPDPDQKRDQQVRIARALLAR